MAISMRCLTAELLVDFLQTAKNNAHELFMFKLHVRSKLKPRLKPRGNTDGTGSAPRCQSLSLQSMVRMVKIIHF